MLLLGTGVCVAALYGLFRLRQYWEQEQHRLAARVEAYWRGVAVGAQAAHARTAITAPSFTDDEAGATTRYWWEGARRAVVGMNRAQLDLALMVLLQAEHFEVEGPDVWADVR